MRARVLVVLLAVSVGGALLAAQARSTLDIYVVDVEGGNATLFVAPSGQSVLIDTGNGGAAAARDAGRILDAAKDARLTQIDHLITTHWHGDHFGAMAELAKQIPIRADHDHGPTIQPQPASEEFLKNVYPTLYAQAKHTVVKPGDKIAISGLDWRIVSSGGQVLQSPLPGAGQPNPYCASFKPQAADPSENAQSVGSHITFGRFRAVHMGDLTWNKEAELMCPNNRLGTTDLLVVAHHGQPVSNPEVMVHALRPRASIINNGTRKGGQPEAMRIILNSPGLEDVWQMHFSLLGGQEYTVPGMFIANTVDEQPDAMPIGAWVAPPQGQQAPPAPVHNGKAYWFKVTAQQDGTFSVTNTRNNLTKTYRGRARAMAANRSQRCVGSAFRRINPAKAGSHGGNVAVLLLTVVLAGCQSRPAADNPPAASAAADPLAEAAQNVRLVGHNDLQGRTALVVTTRSDAANGNWVYVGHHESFAEEKPLLNPITGKMEWNGTSILEITDPAKPKLVWHIPNDTNRNSRGVSVVYDYTFDSSGRDYLIRNSEALTQGETGTDLKYQIFDITSRDSDPSKIALVSEITGTPPDSCGRGCGGKFIVRAHKGWWSQETGYFYAASGEPGFRNVVVQIFDLKNPKEPKFVGRAWLPGLKDGEAGYEGQYSHHPVVDEENKRLYVEYRNAGGQAASFDISNPAQPKLVWSIDMNPPHRGPHTVSPILYNEVPNFGKSALPRTYAFIVDEAGGEPDMMPCPNGVRTGSYMVDITTETKPFPVSVWQVPVGNFCEKGGRFGPHQSAETVNGKINRFEDKIAWLAYFNAGIRVVDLSDPYNLKELGYYIPKTNQNSYPIAKGQPVVIQINDVDIDHRGLAYASDRVGTGLFILEYTGGRKPGT